MEEVSSDKVRVRIGLDPRSGGAFPSTAINSQFSRIRRVSMNRFPDTSKSNTFGKIFIVLVILLTVIAAPAFGQIKSARARVLKTPGNIVTTKKANFQPGDILGTALISITITNGDIDAFLKMRLAISFGGDWTGDAVEVSLIRKLDSNTSFTFTNRDIFSYYTDPKFAFSEFSMTGKLQEHTKISEFNFDAITNLPSIPEGDFSITLTAYEVSLTDPADINSAIVANSEKKLSEETVSFKVVTIGEIEEINITKPQYTPSQDKLKLIFQVPKIPVYNDENIKSTSSTNLEIDGPGIPKYSPPKKDLGISTDPGNFKGWPSNTENGFVTYDLSALYFRAGGSYTTIISFNDWNNLPIKSKTITFSFPTPNFSAKATVTTDDPFRPEFSWKYSITDYSAWTKEYRLYINGQYKGYTTDTSYKLSEPLPANT
ncbi:MAG: hypothetical protein WC784_04700, partial [Candidatus Shapirobacteria bacterium]